MVLSRRNFIKAVGITIGTIMVGNLTGCTQKETKISKEKLTLYEYGLCDNESKEVIIYRVHQEETQKYSGILLEINNETIETKKEPLEYQKYEEAVSEMNIKHQIRYHDNIIEYFYEAYGEKSEYTIEEIRNILEILKEKNQELDYSKEKTSRQR